MNTTLTSVVASEHIAELRRAAEHHRAATAVPSPRTSNQQIVVLRPAEPNDTYDVSRLAQLDDAPAPVSPVMLAFVDGEAVAALSLNDGHAVANPFVPTQKAVALLRLRASQLSRARRRWWQPRILRPRAA